MTSLQEEIIQILKVKSEIDPQEEIRQTIDFMKAYLFKHDFLKSYVLGISGGQDSTLLGKLAQMAVEEYRQENNKSVEDCQFIAVRLPYGEQLDAGDAIKAIEWIKADKSLEVDIKKAVDAMEESIQSTGVNITDFNKGNIKARQRMIAQYAIASAYSGAVLGTDHAAESVTGFYTKYGDGSSDLMPLFRLNKRQGQQILQELKAPKELYQKVPTADLEDDKPLLSDEDKLGVSYQSIDDYLEGKLVSPKDKETIENWYLKTQHKRHLPISIFDDFWK